MLDTETARHRIDVLAIPVDTLAALAGLSASKARAVLSGQRNDSEAMLQINRTLTSLEKLAGAARPLPISMKNAAVLRPLLEEFERGNLNISVQKP